MPMTMPGVGWGRRELVGESSAWAAFQSPGLAQLEIALLSTGQAVRRPRNLYLQA